MLHLQKFKNLTMEIKTIEAKVTVCSYDELNAQERELIYKAIEASNSSYAKYSNFHVGAAVRLANGTVITGCNQENAAFSETICAERCALFAAGAQQPDQPVTAMAIAARNADGLLDQPISPCGSCRQVMIETEQRYGRKIHILLYGKKHIYIVEGIGQLMPLSFTADAL